MHRRDANVLTNEELEQLLSRLQELIVWTSVGAGACADKAVDCRLLMPYYWRLIALMRRLDASRLLAGRLHYMAGNLYAMAVEFDMHKMHKQSEERCYNDILSIMEEEVRRVDCMEREDNLYRVDLMTRCLYAALRDQVVVPSRKEAAELKGAMQRLRAIGKSAN